MTGALPLIVTRPEPGNAATVARAQALGIDVFAVPLFAAQPLAWDVPAIADHDALLLTSAQAVRLAGPGLAGLAALPVHAVGASTAAAARAAGLTVAAVGESGAQPLVDAMTSHEKPRILWLCGRDRSALAARGARLDARPCYAVAALDPPPLWDRLTSAPAMILAHSARAAARIADLAGARRRHLSLVAISDAAAATAGWGWAEIAVAARPDDAAMVTRAHDLWQKGAK